MCGTAIPDKVTVLIRFFHNLFLFVMFPLDYCCVAMICGNSIAHKTRQSAASPESDHQTPFRTGSEQ